MIGAATTSRAPRMGFSTRSTSLANFDNRIEVRPKHFDADVGPHAGREHLDPVDDRLREDVAPAGHLQDAAHFIVDEVALRAAGPLPEEYAGLEWFFQFLADRLERDKRGRIVWLAKLDVERLGRESLGFLAVWGRSKQFQPAAALEQFLDGVPRERLGPAIE